MSAIDPADDLDLLPDVGHAGEEDDVERITDPVRALEELGEMPHTWIELEKVPRRLWEQALAPLHPQQRMTVVRQVVDPHLREIADRLAFKLYVDEGQRRRDRDQARHRVLRSGFPLPTPEPAAARPTVQVNIRLRADDRERLAQAAAAVGLKPTTLARALVLNGAGRILQEHAR